jgi:hypothetical protein
MGDSASDTTALVQSIQTQWDFTMRLLRRSIECFDDDQWKKGISDFEVPWKVAYHTLQCMAYYFRDDPAKTYRDMPPNFGRDWWELSDADAPTQALVLLFHDDIVVLLGKYFDGKHDGWLSEPFPLFGTVLGNMEYAQRHTMHHQGGLNVLSVFHKIDADLWDKEE